MQKISQGWQVAFASLAGLTVGAYSMGSLMQPLLLEPMTQEFHWTRAQFLFPQLFASILGAVVMPLLGRAADLWGLRRVHLPGVIGYGLMLMLMSTLSGSPVQFFIYTQLMSGFAMFQSPPLYAKAISAWMDKDRGIGLGVGMTGNALGAVIVPPIAGYFLAQYGWRDMRLVNGALVILIAFPAIYFFIKEPFAPLAKQSADQRSANNVPGHSVREGVGTPTFWMLVVSFFLLGAATTAALSNMVPLLRDHGFEGAQAAAASILLPALGVGQFVGRFISGFLLDRYQTAKIGVVVIFLSFLGVGGLYFGAGVPVFVAGAFFLGLGLGADLEVAAYYAGRFFGMKNFGALYSLIFGPFIIGNGVGGFLMGKSRDVFGNYDNGVLGVEIAFVVACALIMVLPPYVYKRAKR